MGDGWHTKIMTGLDIMRCKVDLNIIVFRNHGRSMLYTTFQFDRKRMISHVLWEAMDQVEAIVFVKIIYELEEM